MFQVLFFFHIFLQNSLQKLFQFIFLFFYKITKIKIKSFECPKSIRNYEKNNAWSIRHLVDDLLVPSSKQPSVIYCRLTNLWFLLHTYWFSDFFIIKPFVSFILLPILKTSSFIQRSYFELIKMHMSKSNFQSGWTLFFQFCRTLQDFSLHRK